MIIIFLHIRACIVMIMFVSERLQWVISVEYFTCLKFCCHLCEGEESKLFCNAKDSLFWPV